MHVYLPTTRLYPLRTTKNSNNQDPMKFSTFFKINHVASASGRLMPSHSHLTKSTTTSYRYNIRAAGSTAVKSIPGTLTTTIQAPGTTFSTFSDEVRLEGGHGNCCRFATLTGVHQMPHICLAKLWFKGKVRS